MAVPKRLVGCRPKARSTRPAHRPGQVAPEGAQGRGVAAAARPDSICASDACSFCCAACELAHQLRVQVAPGVDGGHQRRPARDRLVRGRARPERLGLKPGDLFSALLQRLALARQRIERGVVLPDARPVDLGDRRGGAIGAAQRLQVVDVQQQPPVARPGPSCRAARAGLRRPAAAPRPSCARVAARFSASSSLSLDVLRSRSIRASCSTLICRSSSSFRRSISTVRSCAASASASRCSAAQTVFGPLRRGRRAIAIRGRRRLGDEERQAHDHQTSSAAHCRAAARLRRPSDRRSARAAHHGTPFRRTALPSMSAGI